MKYIKIAELGLKRVFAYKVSIVMMLFSSIASIFILQKFWLALYGVYSVHANPFARTSCTSLTEDENHPHGDCTILN